MIEKIINEIKIALDNDLYILALSSALTLPDICGKAEFPHVLNTGHCYMDWLEKFASDGQRRVDSKGVEIDPLPYLSPGVIYSLRNELLHQGTPNVLHYKCNKRTKKETPKFKKCDIDIFKLVKTTKDEKLYTDKAILKITNSGVTKIYYANIRWLCDYLTSHALKYYVANKEKFNFFNYHIVDEINE